MASSAPQSPANRDGNSYFDLSPGGPSPSKIRRINQLAMERALSLPPRRLSSPAKKTPSIRPRLNSFHTFDDAVSLFKSSRNIIVLTGAGISTSLGVPDFRSQNGVYNMLVDSVYDDPQELFHIDNFKADPEEFYRQAAKIFPAMQGLVPADGESSKSKAPLVPKYSLTHAFVALLQDKDKLLTNYTQNIDSLEKEAGVSPSKLIQCHGTLATASCMTCHKKYSAKKYMGVVLAGNVPYCKCSQEDRGSKPKQPRQRGRSGKKKRKRDEFEDTDSEASGNEIESPRGLLRPDMTFFGEAIADSYAPRLRMDKNKVDLIVIVGTSLKVEPVNEMLLNIPHTVPQIWISKDRCLREGVKVDIELLGECDVVLEEIARRAGWEKALKHRLWSSEKATELKSSSLAKAKTTDLGRQKGQPLKRENDNSRPPVKPERPLQIRRKSNETQTANLGVKSAQTEIVIKGNDKDITSALGAQITTEPDQINCVTQSKIEVESKTVVDVREPVAETRPEKPKASSLSAPPSSPPKVTVELEEGTHWRWYVKKKVTS